MKPISFVLLISLNLAVYPIIIHSVGSISKQSIYIFKPDGTKHCEPQSGLDLDAMEMKLQSNNISVITKRKGHDGREGIALCGLPTGQINIYEISSSDLPNAVKLGFKELPTQ